MQKLLNMALAFAISATAAAVSHAQCGFAIIPAADFKWFRAEGWATPGVAEAKEFVPVRISSDGKSRTPDWLSGITVSLAVYNRKTDVWFPEAIFSADGAPRRMLRRKFSLDELVRWQMNGRTYAYSYLLGPYDVACEASVDIIDDKGDGKFRVMVPGGHILLLPPGKLLEPPPIPEWLRPPTS